MADPHSRPSSLAADASDQESSSNLREKRASVTDEKTFAGVHREPENSLISGESRIFSKEKSMNHLTNAVLAAAVASIPETVFDSHAVIRVLLTDYPKEYARELYACVDEDDPIQGLHAEIGMSLRDVSGIAPTRKVSSLNIRGRETANQEWRKV
jgi:hypothetical protein